MRRRISCTLAAVAALMLWSPLARAQNADVVSSCGPTAYLTAGKSARLTVDTQGRLCGVATASGASAVTLPTTPLIASGNGIVNTPVSEAAAGIAPSANTTTGKGLVLKSGAGNLYSLAVKIGATSGYVILADATAIATDGAVTYKWCKPVLSNGTLGGDDWAWNPPLAFSTGITANFSTTGCATMTGSTTAEFSGQAK